jgi:hypothetical protein
MPTHDLLHPSKDRFGGPNAASSAWFAQSRGVCDLSLVKHDTHVTFLCRKGAMFHWRHVNRPTTELRAFFKGVHCFYDQQRGGGGGRVHVRITRVFVVDCLLTRSTCDVLWEGRAIGTDTASTLLPFLPPLQHPHEKIALRQIDKVQLSRRQTSHVICCINANVIAVVATMTRSTSASEIKSLAVIYRQLVCRHDGFHLSR